MNLTELNGLESKEAEEAFTRCCGSQTWVKAMLTQRPFKSGDCLNTASSEAFASLKEADWLEAFKHHPKIGDLDSLRKKFATTADLAGNEQKLVESASEEVLAELHSLNDKYLNKFGFIFIVYASGKSAKQMLDILQQRLPNTKEVELPIAATEQEKITLTRLEKLLS